PKGVTGLSEYSIGRFTITVILTHASIPWSDKRSGTLNVFYCMIRVQADGKLPPGAAADEIMAHFEQCAHRLLRGMRTCTVKPARG
ncbi:MAG: hypothetical protein NTX35_19340, partial [Verrucomicrobia bacterium]|nr:hypothetical protein [Verrucomicrobiota bacterium]